MLSELLLNAYRFREEMQNALSVAFLENSACLFKDWLNEIEMLKEITEIH